MTDFDKPSGPKSFSINSLSSLPRSPTNDITFTSAEEPREIIPSKIDLPTPLPAKTPTLCPSPKGIQESIDLIPVLKASEIKFRLSGLGGAL